MLEVLRNIAVGEIIRRAAHRWQSEKVLNGMQYAFQGGKGIEGPIKIATAVAEDAFLYRKPYFSVLQDISKAFDKVERHLGKEMGLRRLGVPEEAIEMILSLDEGNEIYVATAHGDADPFEGQTGWPQGSTEGPFGWVAHYDWLLQLQTEAPNRDPYIIEEAHLNYDQGAMPAELPQSGRCTAVDQSCAQTWADTLAPFGIRVHGGVFADDAKWVARTRRGIQVALDTAEDFLGFHGGQFNPGKSFYTGGIWGPDPDPQAKDFRDDDETISVKMVEPDEHGRHSDVQLLRKWANVAERYLGLQLTDTLWWGEAGEQVSEEVKRVSRLCAKSGAKVAGAGMMLRQVAAAGANTQLKFASVSDDWLEDIWKPAEIAWKQCTKMAVSTHRHLHKWVAGSFVDGTRMEQTMLLMTLMTRDCLAGQLTRNEVSRLQLMMGGSTPVLQQRWNDDKGWMGDWTGQVWKWMDSKRLQMAGGTGFQLSCQGDKALTDLVPPEHRRQIATAGWAREIFMLSDLILPDGETFRPEVRSGGAWDLDTGAQMGWAAAVRKAAGTNGNHSTKIRSPLTGARTGNMWHRRGRAVMWEQDGTMHAGRSLGQHGGWVAVARWTPGSAQEEKRRSPRLQCGAHAAGTVEKWIEPLTEQLPRCVLRADAVIPMCGTESNSHDHIDSRVWTLTDSPEWVLGWMNRHPPLRDIEHDEWHSSARRHNPGDGETTAQRRGDWHDSSIGKRIAMAAEAARTSTHECISIACDGSVAQADCEGAKGTFGWVAMEGTADQVDWLRGRAFAAGMGTVEGMWHDMTSTRAEARGLLDSMRATRRWIEQRRTPRLRTIKHYQDNKAVTDLYVTVADWGPLRWLTMVDKDIWYEIWAEKRWWHEGGRSYEVQWIRSHPEERASWVTWAGEDILNHLSDRWADEAHCLFGSDGWKQPSALPGLFTTTGSWRLCVRGAPIVGNVRQTLKRHLQWWHFESYMREGSGLEVIDPDSIDIAVAKRTMKPPTGVHKVTNAVLAAKVMGGILATETVLTRRTQDCDEQMALCKLCGEGYETNHHMLCECTGSTEVIQARAEWMTAVRKVITAVTESPNAEAAALGEALQEVWQTDHVGKLAQWDGGIALVGSAFIGCEGETEVEEALRRSEKLHDACEQVDGLLLRQGGVEMATRGCFTTEWRRLLVTTGGLSEGDAMKLMVGMGKAMRQGVAKVWRTRSEVRSGLASVTRQTHSHHFELALTRWRRKEEAAGRTLPMGYDEHMRSKSMSEQRKWMRAKAKRQPLPASCPWGILTDAERRDQADARDAVRQRYVRQGQHLTHSLPGLMAESNGDTTPGSQPKSQEHAHETPWPQSPPHTPPRSPVLTTPPRTAALTRTPTTVSTPVWATRSPLGQPRSNPQARSTTRPDLDLTQTVPIPVFIDSNEPHHERRRTYGGPMPAPNLAPHSPWQHPPQDKPVDRRAAGQPKRPRSSPQHASQMHLSKKRKERRKRDRTSPTSPPQTDPTSSPTTTQPRKRPHRSCADNSKQYTAPTTNDNTQAGGNNEHNNRTAKEDNTRMKRARDPIWNGSPPRRAKRTSTTASTQNLTNTTMRPTD